MDSSKSTFSIFNRFFLLGFIISVILFFYLEFYDTYHFLKDDNLNQFLPVIIEGFRQLFGGTLPVLNQYQYTGSPILEVGTYAIFYPFLILSYLISNYIFHNFYLTFEVFAFIHIILGYCMVFLFLKKIKVNNFVSMIGALSFVFSGYVLIASSNWYYILPTIFFLPLILYLSYKLINSNKLLFVVLLGVFRGIYFYSGNAQYFVYTSFFEFLFLILALNRWKQSYSKNLEKYFISIFITLIIALPLIFSQVSIAKNSSRGERSPLDYLLTTPSHPFDAIFGQLLPYPLIKAKDSFAKAPDSFVNLYYYGGLLFIFVIIGLFYSIRNYKFKFLKKANIFLLLALIALLLSFGWRGIIYSLGFVIPLFNSFTHPFKLTLYVSFFFVVYGTIIFSNNLNNFNSSLRRYFSFIILVLFLILIIYHINISSGVSWMYTKDELPLKFLIPVDFGDGRIVSLSYVKDSQFFRENKYDYTDLYGSKYLTYNFATYFGLYHVGGYEPFNLKIIDKNIPIKRNAIRGKLSLDTIKEYGVKWIILSSGSLKEHNELASLPIVYNNGEVTVLEIFDTKPIVFLEDSGGVVDYKIKSNGYDINVGLEKESNLVVNTLYRDNFRVYVDGNEVMKSKDSFGRLLIKVSSGKHFVKIVYVPIIFYFGFYISLILLLILIFYLIIRKRYIKFILSFLDILIKKKVFLILIFILFFIFLFFYTFTRASSIESILGRSTGFNVDIEKSSIISLNKIKLENVGFYDYYNYEDFFSAEEVIVEIDFLRTLKYGLRERRIWFSKILINSVNLETKKLSNVLRLVDGEKCGIQVSGGFSLDNYYFDNILIEDAYLKFNSLGFGNINFSDFRLSLFRELNKYKLTGNFNKCLEINKITNFYS